MTTRRLPLLGVALVAAAAAVLLVVPAAEAAAIVWVGTNGVWSAAANWNPAQVPGPADDVTIAAPAGQSWAIGLDLPAVSVQSLTLGSQFNAAPHAASAAAPPVLLYTATAAGVPAGLTVAGAFVIGADAQLSDANVDTTKASGPLLLSLGATGSGVLLYGTLQAVQPTSVFTAPAINVTGATGNIQMSGGFWNVPLLSVGANNLLTTPAAPSGADPAVPTTAAAVLMGGSIQNWGTIESLRAVLHPSVVLQNYGFVTLADWWATLTWNATLYGPDGRVVPGPPGPVVDGALINEPDAAITIVASTDPTGAQTAYRIAVPRVAYSAGSTFAVQGPATVLKVVGGPSTCAGGTASVGGVHFFWVSTGPVAGPATGVLSYAPRWPNCPMDFNGAQYQTPTGTVGIVAPDPALQWDPVLPTAMMTGVNLKSQLLVDAGATVTVDWDATGQSFTPPGVTVAAAATLRLSRTTAGNRWDLPVLLTQPASVVDTANAALNITQMWTAYGPNTLAGSAVTADVNAVVRVPFVLLPAEGPVNITTASGLLVYGSVEFGTLDGQQGAASQSVLLVGAGITVYGGGSVTQRWTDVRVVASPNARVQVMPDGAWTSQVTSGKTTTFDFGGGFVTQSARITFASVPYPTGQLIWPPSTLVFGNPQTAANAYYRVNIDFAPPATTPRAGAAQPTQLVITSDAALAAGSGSGGLLTVTTYGQWHVDGGALVQVRSGQLEFSGPTHGGLVLSGASVVQLFDGTVAPAAGGTVSAELSSLVDPAGLNSLVFNDGSSLHVSASPDATRYPHDANPVVQFGQLLLDATANLYVDLPATPLALPYTKLRLDTLFGGAMWTGSVVYTFAAQGSCVPPFAQLPATAQVLVASANSPNAPASFPATLAGPAPAGIQVVAGYTRTTPVQLDLTFAPQWPSSSSTAGSGPATNSSTGSAEPDQSPFSGLTDAQKSGIVIGVVGGVFLIAGVACYCLRRRRTHHALLDDQFTRVNG